MVVTNLPSDFSAADVIDQTYQRCDQEKVIEQMGSGLAGWRMPVAEFDGNSAWLEIGCLAWNMGKWIAQLVLPKEVVRWEWKRFRLHYVLVPAQVIKRARQMWVRLMGARSTAEPLLLAFEMSWPHSSCFAAPCRQSQPNGHLRQGLALAPAPGSRPTRWR